MIVPPGLEKFEMTIAYEALDKSDNGARCQFTITLQKNYDNSAAGSQDYHDKLKTIQNNDDGNIAQNIHDGNIKSDDMMNEGEQPNDWSERARQIREDRERRQKERMERIKQRRAGGHRSDIHKKHDIRRTGNNEDELRGLNDDDDRGPRYNNKRNRRRNLNKNSNRNRNNNSSGFGSFLWRMIRPWSWPLGLLIPWIIIMLLICGILFYWLYSEFIKPKGKRVPQYNSMAYKIKNSKVFNSVKKRKRHVI